MNKIWMMGSVAAMATVAVVVWSAQPARSSQTQDWLSRAQTEFASKARDAVIERTIGPARSQGRDAVQNPVVVAMAPATASVVESPMELPVAVVNTPVVFSPVEIARPVEPSVDMPARDEVVSPVVAEPEPREIATSAAVEIAPAPQEAAPLQATPVISSPAQPSVAETRSRELAVKPHRFAKHTASSRTSRRSFDNSAKAQGMRALRRHAPDIAALVRRYM
jgi:hypothetical protein